MNEPELAELLQNESPALTGALIGAYNNPSVDNELQAAANITTYQVSYAFLISSFIVAAFCVQSRSSDVHAGERQWNRLFLYCTNGSEY